VLGAEPGDAVLAADVHLILKHEAQDLQFLWEIHHADAAKADAVCVPVLFSAVLLAAVAAAAVVVGPAAAQASHSSLSGLEECQTARLSHAGSLLAGSQRRGGRHHWANRHS